MSNQHISKLIHIWVNTSYLDFIHWDVWGDSRSWASAKATWNVSLTCLFATTAPWIVDICGHGGTSAYRMTTRRVQRRQRLVLPEDAWPVRRSHFRASAPWWALRLQVHVCDCSGWYDSANACTKFQSFIIKPGSKYSQPHYRSHNWLHNS